MAEVEALPLCGAVSKRGQTCRVPLGRHATHVAGYHPKIDWWPNDDFETLSVQLRGPKDRGNAALAARAKEIAAGVKAEDEGDKPSLLDFG